MSLPPPRPARMKVPKIDFSSEDQELSAYDFSESSVIAGQNNVEMELAKKNLHIAVISKDIDAIPGCIKEVLRYTRGLNYKDPKNSETLLHKCAKQSAGPPVIELLLQNNARIDARDQSKASALHYAAEIGNVAILEYLIQHNANTMLKDKHNQTALHKAAKEGHTAVTQVLLDNSVLINHRDTTGASALHIAVQHERIEVTELLIQRSADILAQNFDDKRPVDLLPKLFLDRKKPSKPSYSTDGKKLYKMLKRKGGCKEASLATPRFSSAKNHSGASRSLSIDHRAMNRSISHDYNPYTNNDGSEVTVDSSESEEDLLLQKCTEVTQKVNQAPRLDKSGFVIPEGSSADLLVDTGKKARKKNVKDEKKALKWHAWFSDWDNAFDKQRSKILKYCDLGIPNSVRGRAWLHLSGIASEGRDSSLYHTLLTSQTWEKQTKEQIEKDIHRTMPGHHLFEEEAQGRQMLTNVLLAYSMYNPEVGYCQGMGFITAMFLIFMPEEDAFWLLDAVADNYGLAGLWKVGMVQVRQCMRTLTNLVDIHAPRVNSHLELLGIPTITYVPQFFLTGFLYSFPLDMAVRIWDSFWLRRFDYFYAVATGIFKICGPVIMRMEMDEMMMFLKFRDGDRPLDFNAEQLIDASTSVFSKLKEKTLRQWENEAKEEIRLASLPRRKHFTTGRMNGASLSAHSVRKDSPTGRKPRRTRKTAAERQKEPRIRAGTAISDIEITAHRTMPSIATEEPRRKKKVKKPVSTIPAAL